MTYLSRRVQTGLGYLFVQQLADEDSYCHRLHNQSWLLYMAAVGLRPPRL